MTQESTAPVWRERVQLSHTIKDGWRVSEVTVEVTYTKDTNAPTDSERVMHVRNTVARGQQVVDELNQQGG